MSRKAVSVGQYFDATVTQADVVSGKASPNNITAAQCVAMFSGYVYTAIERKASVVSSCVPGVYRRKKAGGRSVGKQALAFMRSGAMGRKAAMYSSNADDVEKIEGHPLIDLLDHPNAHWSGSELDHLDAVFTELAGNSYYYIELGQGRKPVSLWPLYPQNTVVMPSKSGMVAGYRYAVGANRPVDFKPEEVSHLRLPNPFNHYYGFAPIQAVFIEAGLYNSSAQAESALMENQARPDYAVVIKNGASAKGTVDNVRTKIEQGFRGADKRGKFMVLSGDIDLKPLNWSPKELQWIEQQKWSRDTIAAAFGVPVSMLSVENVNLANAQAGMVQFLKLTILPRLAIRADRLTSDLLPFYGGKEGDAWVAYENPVPEDQALISARNVQYVTSGVITANEARSSEGLDKIAGGEVLRVNGQPLAASYEQTMQAGQPAAQEPVEQATTYDPARGQAILDVLAKMQTGTLAPDAATAFLVGVIGMEQSSAQSMVNAQVAVIAEPEPEEEPDDGTEAEAETKTVRTVSLKTLWGEQCDCCKDAPHIEGKTEDVPEPSSRFIKELEGFFEDQKEAAFAAMVAAGLAINGVDDAIRSWGLASAEWDLKLLSTVRASLDNITQQGAAQAVNELLDMVGERPELRIAFDVEDPHYIDAFGRESQRFIRSVNDETERQIRLAIQAGIESGENIQQLKQRLEATFGTAPARAEMIARTETARFNGIGRIEQMRQAGLPMKKSWALAGGACELCRAIDKKGAISLDGVFWNLGETLIGDEGGVYVNNYAPVMSHPAHPNCRCAMNFEVDKAFLEAES